MNILKTVLKNIYENNGCILWRGKLRQGYGRIGFRNKLYTAHRFIYEEIYGKLSKNLELDHLCRVRNCINPDHLQPVTRSENILRGLLGRMRTHCPKGHPRTPENSYKCRGNGCKLCGRIANRNNYYRKKLLRSA